MSFDGNATSGRAVRGLSWPEAAGFGLTGTGCASVRGMAGPESPGSLYWWGIMWGNELGRRRWAEPRLPSWGRRLALWLILVALVVGGLLIASMHRMRRELQQALPGSETPPPSEPVPAPARGAPE